MAQRDAALRRGTSAFDTGGHEFRMDVLGAVGRATHQFRHIHSSLLNDLKVPVKIAQEQVGHASVSTTLNIYTHVVDASHRKAVEAPPGFEPGMEVLQI